MLMRNFCKNFDSALSFIAKTMTCILFKKVGKFLMNPLKKKCPKTYIVQTKVNWAMRKKLIRRKKTFLLSKNLKTNLFWLVLQFKRQNSIMMSESKLPIHASPCYKLGQKKFAEDFCGKEKETVIKSRKKRNMQVNFKQQKIVAL